MPSRLYTDADLDDSVNLVLKRVLTLQTAAAEYAIPVAVLTLYISDITRRNLIREKVLMKRQQDSLKRQFNKNFDDKDFTRYQLMRQKTFIFLSRFKANQMKLQQGINQKEVKPSVSLIALPSSFNEETLLSANPGVDKDTLQRLIQGNSTSNYLDTYF